MLDQWLDIINAAKKDARRAKMEMERAAAHAARRRPKTAMARGFTRKQTPKQTPKHGTPGGSIMAKYNWDNLSRQSNEDLSKSVKALQKEASKRLKSMTSEQRRISKIQLDTRLLYRVKSEGKTPQQYRAALYQRASELLRYLNQKTTTRYGMRKWAENERRAIKRITGQDAGDLDIEELQLIAELAHEVKLSQSAWARAYDSDQDMGIAFAIFKEEIMHNHTPTFDQLKDRVAEYAQMKYEREMAARLAMGNRSGGIRF